MDGLTVGEALGEELGLREGRQNRWKNSLD
jgi:hypothetical protein